MFTLPHGHELAEVTATWIQDQVEIYSSQDDVFTEEFLATIIFHSNSQEEGVKITHEAHAYLQGRGTEQVVSSSLPQLLPGPYALVGKQLRDVWKLTDDINGTCMATLKPQRK